MPRVAETIRSTHNGDGAIVLDVRQGHMFSLNFVGSAILELLKQGRGESEIADTLAARFEISRDIAEADVAEFIATLKRHGLVERI
jgi:hypothetical protein